MDLIADGLLFLTALTTGFYCLVLARRLRRFGRSDDGIGQQIAALSAAVEETRSALGQTQARLDEMRREAQRSGEQVTRETARARRLADDLAAAAADAERTLDALYRADRRLNAAQAVTPEPLGMAAEFEIESADPTAGEDVAAGHGRSVVEVDEEAAAERAFADLMPVGWTGGDVLRVERMVL